MKNPIVSPDSDRQIPDSQNDLPGAEGWWRDAIRLCADPTHAPEAVRQLASKGTQADILAVGLVSLRAKSVEILRWKFRDPQRLLPESTRIGNIISKIFDPKIALQKGPKQRKNLEEFKKNHPLRVARKDALSLPDSIRSALGSLLPDLEAKLAGSDLSSGATRSLLEEALSCAVRSTACGSPLYRLEALDAARAELEKILRHPETRKVPDAGQALQE